MISLETAAVIATTAIVTLLLTVGVRIFAGGRATGSVDQRLRSIETAIVGLQEDFKKLSEVLIALANMRGDLRLVEQRVERLEGDIRELRHFEGFVTGPFIKPGG